MDRITKMISGEAEIRFLNNENEGTYVDYDGKVYHYNITSKDTYGITDIDENTKVDEEVVDEGVKEKNSGYVAKRPEDGQTDIVRNTSTTKNRETSQRDDKILENNRFRNDETITNNKDGLGDRKELNNSSFLYSSKKEVNSRIKKLEKIIYGTGSTATQFEKETYKNELKSLKQLRKTLPEVTKSEILPSVEDSNIKDFDFTETDLKKLDKEIKNIIKIVDEEEFINGNYLDEIIYSTDYYQDNYMDEELDIPMSENQIDKYNEKLYDDIYDKIIEKLKDEGISLRYEHDQAVYDRQDLAVKGYNELLDYLDNKNINYEISRSTEAGYVPSVYIKDTDGNVIYRIANHFNNNISEFDKVYNDSYKTTFKDKDYANWKDRILPTLEKEGIFEELEDSSFSIGDDGKLQENGKDVTLDTSETGTTGSLMAIHNLNKSKLKGIFVSLIPKKHFIRYARFY